MKKIKKMIDKRDMKKRIMLKLKIMLKKEDGEIEDKKEIIDQEGMMNGMQVIKILEEIEDIKREEKEMIIIM